MSDQQLRELERRWRETGALEHEVALLRARVRAGALSPEQVELAAWCGHPGAREALAWEGGPGLAVRLPRRHLAEDESWAAELARRAGREGVACALAAAARHSSWWAAEELLEVSRRRVQPAVRALEAWLRRPSPESLAEVSRAGQGSDALVATLVGDLTLEPDAAPVLLDSLVAVLAIDRNGHSEPWRTDMEEAMRAALGAWALGEGDPAGGEP